MDVKGLQCQVCNAYLFEDDDVVFCPDCGAPYHRECYEKVGKCAYEEFHGTDKAYKKPAPRVTTPDLQEKIENSKYNCFNCGHEFAPDEKYCPHCRTPRGLTEGVSFNNDSLGGINPKRKDEDGISATQVRAFTLINTRRYVPKFFSLNKKNKISWNWAAFLIPEGWFFYRKMYKPGIIAILLMILAAVCLIPLNASIVIPQENITNYEFAQIVWKSLEAADSFVLTMAGISVFINLAIRVCCGIFGDYIYKVFSKEKLLNYRPNDEEENNIPLDIRLGKLGGVQPFMFILGYWAVQLIPQLIQSFIL